jgi:predicted NACHT family NTPase
MFASDFLTELSRKYDLSPDQEAAFVTLFTRNDDNDLAAAETLNISSSAFRTRMTGVYKKFSIGGKGAGKFHKLKNFLHQQYSNKSSSQNDSSLEGIYLDALIRDVRSQISTSIQKRCGTMRVLDMEQPITIDSIYTSVNILEKISRNQRRSIEDLLDGCEVENFDRFILRKVRQKRIPALEAVELHNKLMILGKPGAGKTTFLKWLALQCNGGKFNQNRVPLFVTLKEFAETKGQPDLLSFIAKQLTECGIENGSVVGSKILQAGRSIVLLDGLDEVRTQDQDRVLKTICKTSEQFDGNQFVITCRIAAKEYTFDKFTEVEVSDFDDEQIADFADKWFQLKDPVKAEDFSKELEDNPGLQELATNPLLLTLLCLVFEEGGRFPANRSELYKEGLDILMKKWDAKRNIRREEVYKQLSLQRKEDLLSQVAYNAFERSDYFFKQGFVEEQIREYIRNLPNVSNDPETLQLDSEAVLNSIAAQHGLLVERARGIYSFSHLTFQEYFTARWFKEKADGDFSALISHITDKQWREVFLLTVGMLKSANKLVMGMKREIDCFLQGDKKIQKFLTWIEEKSLSVNTSYKTNAVRAFYFDLECNIDCDNEDEYLHFMEDWDIGIILHFNLARDLDRNFAIDIEHDLNGENNPICSEEDIAHDIVVELNENALKIFLNRHRRLDRELDLDLHFKIYSQWDGFYPLELQYTIDIIKNSQLKEAMQNLKNQLPTFIHINHNNFVEWWHKNGEYWTTHLREIAFEHRNICHEFKFSKAQTRLLQKYYDANRLLIECLNSDCYVSREVRAEIEDSLLLPIKSLS